MTAGDVWWRIVRGTGLRATMVKLMPGAIEAVRARCDQYIREHEVHEVVLDTHIARGRH